MKGPDYIKYVVELQTVEDVNGIRCYHCYQLLGNVHGKGCMVPAGTAMDELGQVIKDEIARVITAISNRLETLANWIQKIAGKHDKI